MRLIRGKVQAFNNTHNIGGLAPHGTEDVGLWRGS